MYSMYDYVIREGFDSKNREVFYTKNFELKNIFRLVGDSKNASDIHEPGLALKSSKYMVPELPLIIVFDILTRNQNIKTEKLLQLFKLKKTY